MKKEAKNFLSLLCAFFGNLRFHWLVGGDWEKGLKVFWFFFSKQTTKKAKGRVVAVGGMAGFTRPAKLCLTTKREVGFYSVMYFITPPTTIAENFAWVLTSLVRALVVWQRSSVLIARLSGPLRDRVVRVGVDVGRLIAQIEAGLVRPWRPRPRAPGGGRPKREVSASVRARLAASAAVWRGCPTRLGWLVAVTGWEVAGCRAQLESLLARPEVRRLLAASPRLGMALRPVCHMLGIDPKLYEDVPVEPEVVAAPVVEVVEPPSPEPVEEASPGDDGLVVPLSNQKSSR